MTNILKYNDLYIVRCDKHECTNQQPVLKVAKQYLTWPTALQTNIAIHGTLGTTPQNVTLDFSHACSSLLRNQFFFSHTPLQKESNM